MSHNTWNYPALLRQRGFRVTPQRRLILDAVCESGTHATPQEIYRRVQTRAPHLNRATVYRNLDFLCAMRLITSCEGKGKRKVYELASPTPHHHLVCRKCRYTIQVDHSALKSFLARLERDYNFAIETNHLVLTGLCSQCQKQT